MNRVSADLVSNPAAVQQIQINAWGVLSVLHTFSGRRVNNPSATRDWMLTTVWVAAMDALAVGVILMVLSSYYVVPARAEAPVGRDLAHRWVPLLPLLCGGTDLDRLKRLHRQ